MGANAKKYLLPFASYINNQTGVLEKETEQSAVFCLSELNRNKGGGLFRKKETEKTVFVTKVYYPFWVGSFRDLRVIFDGLNTSSHTILYPSVPDLKSFTNDLNGSSTRQIYSALLANHMGYFQESNGEKALAIDGLIADLDFAKEFANYIGEVTAENQVTDGVLISPALDLRQIEKGLKSIDESNIEFAHELTAISETIKSLNAKTQSFIAALRGEVAAIDDKYSGRIREAQLEFEEKKSLINKEYSDKVHEVSDKLEQQNVALNTDVIRLEKILDEINAGIEQTDAEIKNAMINKDEQAERKLKEKKADLKKKTPEVLAQIRTVRDQIRNLEDEKRNQLFQLRQENETNIKDASRGLLEIEAARDAEKKICQNEMEKIEDYTSKITVDLDKIAKKIEITLIAFGNLGLRGEKASPMLVYMPFYLFCYLSQSDKRFVYVAPSTVNTMDMGVRLKAFGRNRLPQLFQPRSQKIVSLLNRFIQLLNDDVAFRHEITGACGNADMLKSKEALESIRKGLNGLKEGGWISSEAFESFSQTLSQL